MAVTLLPGMFMTAQKVTPHVSVSLPEYVLLLFWEEQAAGVKVRQEIFLEALEPFQLWSVPGNTHEVERLQSPVERRMGSRTATICSCPISVLWVTGEERALPCGRCEENVLIEGCGHWAGGLPSQCLSAGCRVAFCWVCS